MKLRYVILLSILTSLNAHSDGIPILMYHEVVSDASKINEDDTVVSVSTFNSQMKWLKENNYVTISLSQLSAYMNGTFAFPPNVNPIIITFDDGWHNQLNALPALNRYNFKATFNIIAGYPGNSPLYMNWDRIKMLHANGHEIASHTMTHPQQMRFEDSFYEIQESKKRIEYVLNTDSVAIAWPNGYYTTGMVDIAVKSGYQVAQTVDENWCTAMHRDLTGTPECKWLTKNRPGQNKMTLKRIFIDGRCSIDEFGNWVRRGHSSICKNSDKPRAVGRPKAAPIPPFLTLYDDGIYDRELRDEIDIDNRG